MSVTYRTPAQLRAAVTRALLDAAEAGPDELSAELSEIIFNTDEHLLEASVMALTEGGDTFAAELSTAHSEFDGYELAFKVAMALHRSGS